LRIFDTPEALGQYAAQRIVERLRHGVATRGRAALGCPGGRSPGTTYAALARALRESGFDGTRLHLVMMDEYVEPDGAGWRACPYEAHYSCTRFGDVTVRQAVNAGLARPIARAQLHVPDPNTPRDYERLIANLGGIDAFILASGTTDGHVAFNPSGTPVGAGTRRVELSDATRRDNMRSFPTFRALEEVPRYGVTVGPATIANASHAAFLVLLGSEKGPALRRILSSRAYDPDWPSTVIHACNAAEILADRQAAAAAEVA
jgi:glucosamine-6-phosphate deaminase